MVLAVMQYLYVDYSNSMVGHICNVAGNCIQGHIPKMLNVCIVFKVTLFIALSSYEAYLLTYFSYICTGNNLCMGHIFGIREAYLFLAHI